jgi:hypothetical protein
MIASALMLAALVLPGDVPAPLAPLGFLVGHCWRGTVQGGGVDTHCFTLAVDGVHDRHQVVAGGQTVYSGETLYSWDAAAQAIRFVYKSPDGVMAGNVHAVADGLDFGTADFVSNDGKHLPITVHWKRVGDSAYEAIDNDVAAGAAAPRRYTRID